MEESVPVAVTPSRVIHIRNLPPGVSEEDIRLLGMPFGQVSSFVYIFSDSLSHRLTKFFCYVRKIKHL